MLYNLLSLRRKILRLYIGEEPKYQHFNFVKLT